MVKLRIKEVDKEVTYRIIEEKDVIGYIKRKYGSSAKIKNKNGKYTISIEGEYIAKISIANAEEKRKIERGAVFYADLGKENGTCVQAGIRPVVVVSNSRCNHFSPVISVISLTTQPKPKIPTHMKIISTEENNLSCDSTALCEQIISLPKINLKEKIGDLEAWQLKKIETGMCIQLGLEA